MPVHSCSENSKPGYQWGGSGKCYTYNPNSKSSKERARRKAEAQGKAAYASGYKGSLDYKYEQPR